MRKLFFVFLLLLILLFSGCIGQEEERKAVGAGITKGAEFTEFSSISEVDSGDEKVEVNAYVQNLGGGSASDIELELYQLSGFTLQSGPHYVGSTTKLVPPDTEFNIPGDTLSAYWTLRAPMSESDKVRSLFCKLKYTYESRASTNIELVSKTEWDSKGGASAFKTYSTATAGPVTISIIPLPAVRISDPTVLEKTVPIDIILKNTGSGVIDDKRVYDFKMTFTGGEESEELSKSVQSPKIVCESVEGLEGGLKRSHIRLFGVEQERSIRCDLTLPFEAETGSIGYIVETSIKYEYSINSPPLNIKVRKK